jgi:DNA-binding CsgD family transcriptional regulator
VTGPYGSLEDLVANRLRRLLATCPACGDREERQAAARAAVPRLTVRRLEVLALAAEGLTSDQIATRLTISRATAKTHLAWLFGTFAAQSRTELVVKAIRAGVIE